MLFKVELSENYLTVGTEEEQIKIAKFIKRGTCFIAYQIEEEIRFAPSKFLGYVNNSLEKHIPSKTDGRDTNEMIISILEAKPIFNEKLEKKNISFCRNLGLQPGEKGAFGAQRKYWLLNLKSDFNDNEELTGEFPEGKVIERIHKSRERNSQVIQIAKHNFKTKYGKLFCQIYGFDFEATYGEIGKDFIEAHHTIPVSEMKPEDITMLCSNCHKMVHKRRP